uniref:Uncharacterized protein n=1 Tax=Arundo donax TaxID=35708 RepID=A0A0A9AL80_ARUDO
MTILPLGSLCKICVKNLTKITRMGNRVLNHSTKFQN